MKRPTRRGPCHEISGVKDLNLPTTAACPASDPTYRKIRKVGKGESVSQGLGRILMGIIHVTVLLS